MKKLFLSALFSCCLFLQGSFAQTNLQDPLPQDPEVITGKLPNGITYYIRHNEEPKNRASFYIIRNAGALLETEEQNGLAHFLEHMSFQGTRNFPGKGIISTLEKYGVAFGRNINAYTAHNETVYNLSSVPTENASLLDTCLLMLHDWSYYLSLEDAEIDAERGVISEEWRTRRTSQFRLQQQISPVLFKGSMYAIRDVIGSLDVINNFKYQTIKDFYHKWYRTDLEAVAIVGDFDVKRMEEKVREILSKVPAIKDPEPRPFFEIPYHEEMYYCLATDKEAQNTSIKITTVFPETAADKKNTHAYLKDNLLIAMYNSMASARMAELMHQADPPFMAGDFGFSGLVRGYDAYSIATVAKPGEEALALESILTENERVRRFGFTASELERVKTNLMVGLESAYKTKDKTDNDSYASSMQDNFLHQEPMVSADYYYDFMKALIPSIKVEEVNAKAAGWNAKGNRTLIVSGPSEGVKHLTEAEAKAIMEKVEKSEIKPYVDATSQGSLIQEEPAGGKIVKTRELPEFEATEWTLDNGARVIFRKAGYDKDNVQLYGYSKGGISVYDDLSLLPSANEAAGFVSGFGLGDYDAIALGKMLTGKMASCTAEIGNRSETISGSCIPNDFETMMQLLYLRFEKPRFDKDIFTSIVSRQASMLPTIMKNPQKIMQDSVQLIMTSHHPRTLVFNEDYLKSLDLEKIEKVYRDRIKDASDFIFFVVGDIDAATVKPLVEKYIGSIRSEYRKEEAVDRKVRFPEGRTEKTIGIDLETRKATVITIFNKPMEYSMYNVICNSVLQGVLELRYTENIREKEGGTYGVSVNAGYEKEPRSEFSMNMSFECDPDNASRLKGLIVAEVEKLQRQAPTAEEVGKVVSNQLKNREQSRNHNSFWMNALVNQYVNGINTADPKNFEDILKGISPDDIMKFARKLFKGADFVDMTFKSIDK